MHELTREPEGRTHTFLKPPGSRAVRTPRIPFFAFFRFFRPSPNRSAQACIHPYFDLALG